MGRCYELMKTCDESLNVEKILYFGLFVLKIYEDLMGISI